MFSTKYILIKLITALILTSILSAQIPVSDAPHYDIFADFDLSSKSVEVFVVWKLTKTAGARSVDFEISPLAEVSYIDLRATDQIYSTINYGFSDRRHVSVTIPSMFDKCIASDEVTLEFRYTLPIEMMDNGQLLVTRDDLWYPSKPGERPTFRLVADMPPGMAAYSNGNLEKKRKTEDAVQFVSVSTVSVDEIAVFCSPLQTPVTDEVQDALAELNISTDAGANDRLADAE